MAQASSALEHDVTVAVIGAGTMGSGIAMVAAAAGHPVLLYDAMAGAAQAGYARQRADLEKLVARGKLSSAIFEERLARLRPVETIDALEPARLVIEAIVEDLEIKTRVFREVESLVAPDAILATNTSSLSITALAARLQRPGRLVGMHFFNPAPILPLVEVVSSRLTEPEVASITYATAQAWGKIPVHCTSTPGFIVNRVARPFYGEALRLASEGAATPATLDAILRETGGFRMGPFALMDLIGHDVNFAVTQSVYGGLFHDPRYKPSLLQQELVLAGLLGRKTGRGFYDHAEGAPESLPDEVLEGPRPASIIIEGDLGPAQALALVAEGAGIAVERRDGAGIIRLQNAALALTDGRTATERLADGGPGVLFDLALDYAAAGRMAIARADQESDTALAEAAGFFQALGKRVSAIDDTPGLAVMRTVAMLTNEAMDAVHFGIASAADVDLSMMKGVNYPCGPLAWGDTIGPARIVAVLDALASIYGEDRYRISPLLRRRARAGLSLTSSRRRVP
jgi:3-hydroxybutyryl-CoA dehydrogenase